MSAPDALRIAIVSDTHVPDRATGLHPALLPGLRALRPAQILHAGDVCAPQVLAELEQVAPVLAVRGNRDWLLRGLPWVRQIELGGAVVALAHGQGSLWNYLNDKWQMLLDGYRFSRYRAFLLPAVARASVIVYGHTHVPENRVEDGRLWFNPGSACVPLARGAAPSFGLLTFPGEGGLPCGEIFPLEGYRLERRKWLPSPPVL